MAATDTTAPAKTDTTKAPAKTKVPTGAQIATSFETALKGKFGNKLEKEQKQTYFRVKIGSDWVYIHPQKKHARVTLGVDLPNADHVAEVVAFIETMVALQKKVAETEAAEAPAKS